MYGFFDSKWKDLAKPQMYRYKSSSKAKNHVILYKFITGGE